jgi:hypothetical protein
MSMIGRRSATSMITDAGVVECADDDQLAHLGVELSRSRRRIERRLDDRVVQVFLGALDVGLGDLDGELGGAL